MKTLVEGRVREEQRAFIAFRSYYLFRSHFCTPAQGHEKGGVEHSVGFSRRNFMVPIPRVASFEELNAYLLSECQRDDVRIVHGQPMSIGEAWQHERPLLRLLPTHPFACCVTRQASLTPYRKAHLRNESVFGSCGESSQDPGSQSLSVLCGDLA